ncbi:hypothetical protein [Desulfobacula toluolica]|uniref:Uncharacterized protein n=1 Tax=Desulfobacula toluolica (strain DSM 7467 / Tol2) TaxID=651182 RepID=K0NNN6_DESTT|nr:hypothetical protein [Desulfobacula toluolica]CCK82275.1 uncharacterized protein TOL2_C41190 [Desulfobacula toluolica Tol2]
MDIIIYSDAGNTQKDKLEKEIYHVCNIMPVMVFDFKSFFNVIKSRLYGQYIVVFLIKSAEELEFLYSNKQKLFSSQYILILPNEDKQLIKKGLLLYPRYLAFACHGFKDMSAVLNKMIWNNTLKEKKLENLTIQTINNN